MSVHLLICRFTNNSLILIFLRAVLVETLTPSNVIWTDHLLWARVFSEAYLYNRAKQHTTAK